MKNIFSDREFWFIALFNLYLAAGYIYNWFSVDTIIWIYFFQSIIIGIGNTVRMAKLQSFSTKNLQVNGESVEPTSKTKWTSALFFMFHFGFFHFVYFIFLVVFSVGNGSKTDIKIVMLNIMIMAVNTIIATWSNIIRDRDEKQNIGTLLFTPYLRVVPMHIFIILGFTQKFDKVVSIPIIGNTDIFWVFLLLKTISDLLMHIITEKTWRVARTKPIGGFI
ncbi:MAG: hypothetical protein HUU47_02795 [Bacteroidetes bacterium]|nr:hypothetical protein [Bacteroidota bacterium]